MKPIASSRFAHYLLLITVCAALTLPGLGSLSLWDIDEGLNAEAAREMLESGNFVVPTFNFQPRNAKPALLYWLQALAYQRFGVNEFAARLPSAVAIALSTLLLYELGRRMFSPRTGLFAGLGLISALQVCVLAHAATPDAVLLACLMAVFLLFWIGSEQGGRNWAWMIGPACGLAMLAKGPAGLILPASVIGYYFMAQKQFRRLLEPRLLLGLILLILVAGPWYILVGAETRGRFLSSFWKTENVGRFLTPMEGHTGPIWYYVLALIIGLTPWCIFLLPTLANAWHEATGSDRPGDASKSTARPDAVRFLLSWVAVYLGFFTLAQTKLPNYILPAYPPLVLLTARFMDRWLSNAITVPRWVMPLSLSTLAAIGAGVGIGKLVAGGVLTPQALQPRVFSGLAQWAWIGLIPVFAAILGAWCLKTNRREGLIGAILTASVLFIGLLAAFPSRVVDAQKAPRALVEQAGIRRPRDDVRVATLAYFQPSLVFYCQRLVQQLDTEQQAIDLLRGPLPAFVICPAAIGEPLASRAECRLAGRRKDLYQGREIVVLTNSPK